MENNNNNQNGLSVEKSLEIISQAIRDSRSDFQRRGGTAMLIWGTVLLLVSGIVMLGLALTDNRLWHIAWFLIPVLGWPLDRLASRNYERRGHGENLISKTVGQVWCTFGIFAVATGILAFLIPLQTTAIIVLLLGMAGAITGWLSQSWTIFLLGIISGLGGLLCSYWLNDPTYIPLIMAMASLLDLIIPGLIFNRRTRKQQ